jgi:hypothetical protein
MLSLPHLVTAAALLGAWVAVLVLEPSFSREAAELVAAVLLIFFALWRFIYPRTAMPLVQAKFRLILDIELSLGKRKGGAPIPRRVGVRPRAFFWPRSRER